MSRKATLVLLAAIVIAAGAGGAWLLWGPAPEGGAEADRAAPAVKYHCPMHPTMVSDGPGDCPICYMSLVPIGGDEEEMEMETESGTGSEAGEDPDEAGVEGLSAVRLSMRKRQLIGVRTAAATRAPFRRTIRAVGRVTFDETRLKRVHAKISGYVEKLHANATGEPVRRGQPLLEIYSPELLSSQQEYLLALRARERTAGSRIPSVAASGEDLVRSARRRLELFDLSDGQIRRLEETGEARRTVTLHAPISGIIIERHVTEGERIEPATPLLELADLSRVWVLASVYEYELPFVREGQEAAMTLSYLPDETYTGRVSLVYPVLEAATRTARVRLEFPNPGLALKPDMYADVTLVSDLGERLGVPVDSVMETGVRSIVFVEKEEGFFVPREVTVGLRLPELYEIREGLAEGERVLTAGNFYVDSESKLKAALAAMAEGPGPGGHAHQGQP